MTHSIPPPRTKYRLEVEVDESQREELQAAWLEIIQGKRSRMETIAHELEDITERARIALEVITKAIRGNPGTGQSTRLVRFIAGCYNGDEYQFDLTDLRALDTSLANACLDYLNYDRLGKTEVHNHLPGGSAQLDAWIDREGIDTTLHLSDDRRARLDAAAKRARERRDTLLKHAVDDLLAHYEGREFGCLRAGVVSSPFGDDPEFLVHARSLSSEAKVPLCGAGDGPWSPSAFGFARVTCPHCKDIVLGVDP